MKPRRSTGQLNHRRWRRLRDQVVREEPVCRLRLPGCTIISTTGDHIMPVKYRPDLKFERGNVQGACTSCNHKKGAKSPRQVAEIRRHRPRAKALGFFA